MNEPGSGLTRVEWHFFRSDVTGKTGPTSGAPAVICGLGDSYRGALSMNDRAGAYPLFIPPAQFSGKSIREWTNEQAEGYKAWLLLELDTRVNVLLEYIGLQFPSDDDDRAEFLAAVGDRAESLLQSQQFSERCEGGRQLTNEGYSLAADLGLLVAKLLLSRFEAIYWEIVRGPKAHMSLNRPVLMGFDSSYLDPVGGSIAEAAAVARGDENGAIWKRMFEYWSTKASS